MSEMNTGAKTIDYKLSDAASNSESYVYRPLRVSRKEIRLLIVHSGSSSEPVSAKLRRVSLESSPNYETISYVWGDASVRATILIGGKELDVPASAERAIRRMRQEGNDRVLWIDAVCINQADIDERGQQVTVMGSIYSCTQQTLVWLGDSDEGTPTAIETIRAMHKDLLQTPNDLELLFDDMNLGLGGLRYSESHEYCPHDTEPLVQFFSNTWFDRLWSPDQRDSIFATLGLAKAVKDKYQSRFLKPEYNKPFQNIVRDAAVASIWEEGHVRILTFASGHINDDGDPFTTPSWIPRPGAKHNPAIHAHHMDRPHQTTDAYISQYAMIPTDRYFLAGEPDVLCLHGIVVDRVARVSSILTTARLDEESFDVESLVETIIPAHFFDVITLLDHTDDDRQHWISDLARTSAVETSESELGSDVLDDWAQLLKTVFPDLIDSRVDSNAELTKSKFFRYSFNRRIFRTSAGLVGLGPRWMRPFDIAVVVHGFPLPIILRPIENMERDIGLQESINGVEQQGRVSDQRKRYRFIGECYTTGIMLGEAVLAYRQIGGTEEVFEVV